MNSNVPSKIANLRAILILIFLLFDSDFCQAQSSSSTSAPQAVEDYAIVQAGPHSRVWQNSLGQRVTEIETGMNFWDGQQWTPSNPQFVAAQDGSAFVASQIQDQTKLAANINCAGAVTVTTPDNVTLRSTPIAIGLYDAASGLSAIVATLTNSTGVLVDAQDVVYSRALIGGAFAASVVYSLPDTASFHQDVVFVGFDPAFNPTNWGFAESATNTLQIQIITEFYDPPQPLMLTNYIYSLQDPGQQGNMVSLDLIDYTLDFGDYVFGPGWAYTGTTEANSDGARAPVAKDFVTSSNRTFLVESVPYLWLASQLQALPPVTTNTSSVTYPRQRAKIMRMAAASLPSLRDNKPSPASKIVPGKKAALVTKPRGVRIDYVVTVSSTVEPTLYASDTTYFVSGSVVNSSAVRMESAVFKYPTNNVGTIDIQSTLTLATTNYRPAVFTAADDNTVGTTLSTNIWAGYTGNPGTNRYGGYALSLDTTNVALNNLRFCYLNYAIDAAAKGETVSVAHSELVDCGIGIYSIAGLGVNALTLNVNNCLFASVGCPFEPGAIKLTGSACNCTIDSCNDLIEAGSSSSGSTFDFTNSILSNVSSNGALGPLVLSGGNNAFYNSSTFGSAYTTVSSTPYQSVGAGNYYLSSTSSFLTAATTNIGSALLSQLQMKTTQPPLILTNSFTVDTVLAPVAQRDTTATALGFHYDPLDFISACDISNATLLMTNGVALAYYDNLGVWLQDDSQLVSQGAPNYRNYLVYYGLVQEQPVNLWGVTNAVAQSLPIASLPFNSANKPSIFLRLTTICAPQGETNLFNTGDSNQVISGLTLRDCEIYGAGANWVMSESNNEALIALTNNVFHRVPFAVSNNATMISYNNLFYGTTNTNGFTISIRHRTGTSSPNTNENNVFDGATASLDGTIGYNAYLHGGTNTTIQGSDIVTNLTWLAGPLGAYYQTPSSPLVTNGSTYATNLGLYHYTVGTNELLDGLNLVSRGYHYVALGTNGLPLDTSGDGVADYLADGNGNNSGGTGSWTNYISPNGLVNPSGLVVFTPFH